MSIGMTRVQHVKIPVTNLRRSVAWYGTLLDLVPFREFVEQGVLRGAALRSPESGVVFALRERRYCAGQPDLTGFDLVAVRMAGRDSLPQLAAKCDRLATGHGPVQDRGPNEAVMDVPDPDGTVLRFFWERDDPDTTQFIGLSFDTEGPPTFYDTPRVPQSARG
jgi:catechol 2,3-dioxygenase-like lactoylglutathione lyase family enzyme